MSAEQEKMSQQRLYNGLKHKQISKEEVNDSLLFEVAWEVCNKVGGIYTVIQSKVSTVLDKWDAEKYVLLGPYIEEQAAANFEPVFDSNDKVANAVDEMNRNGYRVFYGHWLIAGRPRAILFDPYYIFSELGGLKYRLWDLYGISTPEHDDLINKLVSFGHQVFRFFQIFSGLNAGENRMIAHFHEWMAGISIMDIRRENLPVKIVFTTHATLLGRYLAMNDPFFYEHLPQYNWGHEARHFNVEHIVNIERAATRGAHVFTTVSEITGEECKYFLEREPDVVLPNGINVDRFEVMHEFQNLHRIYKERINEFVMSHFFQSYSFDLDKTLYFFTSGRYEYKNKGYDLTLEALARLNYRMKKENIDMTVVTFFITKNPFTNMNPGVLRSKAMLEEIQRNCEEMQGQIAKKFFSTVASNNRSFTMPDLNQMIDDYMVLRLRNNLQSWRSNSLPPIITHTLCDEPKDEIMNFLKVSNLLNHAEDKVKVVYHPDFITTSNPLFRMEYYQFIRGCHLGVFPSYYEPWGYTPLECIASGVPSITSDLAGFGSFAQANVKDYEKAGLYVLERRNKDFGRAADELVDIMMNFIHLNRRQRIMQRNRVEAASIQFDWEKLIRYYSYAYGMAVRSQ